MSELNFVVYRKECTPVFPYTTPAGRRWKQQHEETYTTPPQYLIGEASYKEDARPPHMRGHNPRAHFYRTIR